MYFCKTFTASTEQRCALTITRLNHQNSSISHIKVFSAELCCKLVTFNLGSSSETDVPGMKLAHRRLERLDWQQFGCELLTLPSLF